MSTPESRASVLLHDAPPAPQSPKPAPAAPLPRTATCCGRWLGWSGRREGRRRRAANLRAASPRLFVSRPASRRRGREEDRERERAPRWPSAVAAGGGVVDAARRSPRVHRRPPRSRTLRAQRCGGAGGRQGRGFDALPCHVETRRPPRAPAPPPPREAVATQKARPPAAGGGEKEGDWGPRAHLASPRAAASSERVAGGRGGASRGDCVCVRAAPRIPATARGPPAAPLARMEGGDMAALHRPVNKGAA
eukprot:scaffold2106_cov174-Prasinococcus_capsulatus_cf.AAC.1